MVTDAPDDAGVYQINGSKIKYRLRDMAEWSGVSADLAISDPPFGLGYDGKASNYNRDVENVVDGYVEWSEEEYADNINSLLDVFAENTVADASAIIFSGKDNSHIVAGEIGKHDGWRREGKLYWSYNFAPYCEKRPAHNVYEIYWMVKGDEWHYDNSCRFDHCQEGEANLSMLDVKRNYMKEMPKYPTRLPLKVPKILIDHFSQPGDVVFDPLAGSGSVGIGAGEMGRDAVMGDKNAEALTVFSQTIDELGSKGGT